MPKIHKFSDEELDTCEICNKVDLSVKPIAGQYICAKCNHNRCASCLKAVKYNLNQGLYCDDCAEFLIYGTYDDIMHL